MRTICSLILFGVVGVGAGSAPGVETGAPAAPSAQLAEACRRKLEALKGGSSVASVITQAEANSYLNLSLAPHLPEGVKDIELRFTRDRLSLNASLDLDRLKASLPKAADAAAAGVLGGRLTVELRGRLRSSEDGFGSFELEDARLGPVVIPPANVEQLVAAFTRSAENPLGFDIHAPFRLPYALRRLRLEPGRVVLERRRE